MKSRLHDLARYEFHRKAGEEHAGWPPDEKELVGVVAAITPWNYLNQINIARSASAIAGRRGARYLDTPHALAFLGRPHRYTPSAGVANVVTAEGPSAPSRR